MLSAGPGTLTVAGELRINRLGFGAMRLTGPAAYGPPADRGLALAVLRRAVEAGVNFIDTADVYGPEVSEELIAAALSPYPDGLVIATKGGNVRLGHMQWEPNGHPDHLRSACEGSLRRLRLDQLSLYQWHRPDPKVPFDESLGALIALRDEGKIRHIGLSNVDTAQLRRAQQLTPVASVQVRYNPVDRAADQLLDACESDGMAFVPWGPISDPGASDAVLRVAERRGVSAQRVTLAWLLARSPVMVPIPGTASLEHLDDNMAAASLRLDDDEFDSIAQGSLQL